MGINILILAAGGQRAIDSEPSYPLCLVEIEGVTLLELIVRSLQDLENSHYTYAFLENDIVKFNLDKVASHLTPNSRAVKIQPGSKGSGSTAFFSSSGFDPDNELLILSANEIVRLNYAETLRDFRARSLDGGTLTFNSVHPRYSYVKTNSDGLVIEASQQKQISTSATAGVFWYRKTRFFSESFKRLVFKNLSLNGQFFIAPTFNEMILAGLKVGVMEIEKRDYTPLKDSSQHQQLGYGGQV